jgi:hypothetical protein
MCCYRSHRHRELAAKQKSILTSFIVFAKAFFKTRKETWTLGPTVVLGKTSLSRDNPAAHVGIAHSQP